VPKEFKSYQPAMEEHYHYLVIAWRLSSHQGAIRLQRFTPLVDAIKKTEIQKKETEKVI